MAQHKDWRFGQCFGEKDNEEEFAEVDVLSAVRFDESGDYLATGDKGGRIVIFERTAKGIPPSKRKRRWIEERDEASSGAEGPLSAAFSRTTVGGASGPASLSKDDEHGDDDSAGLPVSAEYRFLSEFQSHEAEFDYLKSLEIEEKINTIAWCKGGSYSGSYSPSNSSSSSAGGGAGRVNGSLFLLSTNDKTIKLWKISERRPKSVAEFNVTTGPYGSQVPPTSLGALRVPRLISGEPQMFAFPRRVFSSAHSYHINSLACCSDGETFLSADDLRINLWSLENARLSWNVVDIKPPTLEELTEVITAAEFHPSHCHLFVYASSRGTVKLGDMRASALCDKHAKAFEEPEDPSGKTYFSEIIASVSDLEFTKAGQAGSPSDGRFIVSRDYLSIKIWDVAMESRPLTVIPVHESLRPRLVELYESDCIFDKFEVSCGPPSSNFSSLGPSSSSSAAAAGAAGGGGADGSGSSGLGSGGGSGIMTGSYSNCFKIYDTALGSETTIELAKGKPKPPAIRPVVGGTNLPQYDAALGVSFFSPIIVTPPPLSSGAYSPFAPPFSAPSHPSVASLAPKGGFSSSSSSSAMAVDGEGESSSAQPSQPGSGDGGGADQQPQLSFGTMREIPIAYDPSLLLSSATAAGQQGQGLLGVGGFDSDSSQVDFGKKVLHFSWHPFEDIVAVAGLNNLYIYHV